MCAIFLHVNRTDGLKLCCRLLVVNVAYGGITYTYLLHCIVVVFTEYAHSLAVSGNDHIDLFAQRAYILHNYFKYFLSQFKKKVCVSYMECHVKEYIMAYGCC